MVNYGEHELQGSISCVFSQLAKNYFCCNLRTLTELSNVLN